MKDRTKEAIDKERESLMSRLNTLYDDIELIDSYIEEEPNRDNILGDKIGIWYLSKSLEKMAEADLVVLAKGWESNRGCKLEELVASKYGMKRLFM